MLSGSRRGFAQHDIDGANHILHVDDFILVGISSRKVERLVVIFAEGIENGGLQVGGIDARCKVGIALLEDILQLQVASLDALAHNHC